MCDAVKKGAHLCSNKGISMHQVSVTPSYFERYTTCFIVWTNKVWFLCIGLNVVEVAHDNSPSVKMYITQDLNLVNSYDTWHGRNHDTCWIIDLSRLWHHLVGTKNVAKAIKSIAIGALKRSGTTWFPELSDKSKMNYMIECFIN